MIVYAALIASGLSRVYGNEMKTDCANLLAKSQSPIPSHRSHIVNYALSLRWGILYAPLIH